MKERLNEKEKLISEKCSELLQLAQPEREQLLVKAEEKEISILSVELGELRRFAKHNLEVLKTSNWSSFRGTDFSDGDPVQGDVKNAVLRYESFVNAVEVQSEEFKKVLDFSKEFFQWMYEKEDNSSLYANMDLYHDDFYHEIVLAVGDMMEGGYSQIKMFITDNRHMTDWLDEEGNFREDIKKGLDRFEMRVNELEQSYSNK